MRGASAGRQALGVTLAALAAGAGLSACGETKIVTHISTSSVGQNQQRLQHAVAADTHRNIAHYWKGRFHFAVDTKCKPGNPGGEDFSCRTTIRSSRHGTKPCRIRTVVRGDKQTFHFKAPLPFARDVFAEACPTLHSELGHG
jgi:hypothetical protein